MLMHVCMAAATQQGVSDMCMTHLHLYQQLASIWCASMQVIDCGKELIVAECTLCRGSFSIRIQALGN